MKKKIRNWLYYSMKGFEKFHFTALDLAKSYIENINYVM